MKIVSFCTLSYRPVAMEFLLPSLDRMGLDYSLEVVNDFSSWELACQHKASVIRAEYESGDDLLWVDCDAVIHSDPRPWFEVATSDMAAYRLNGELLSGTLWFAGGRQTVRDLLDRWIQINMSNPSQWDQRNMDAAIGQTPGITVEALPPELCFIFDTMRVLFPEMTPVIEHYQASRTMKRRINVSAHG